MDPNQTLVQLRTLVDRVLGPGWPHETEPDPTTLLETVCRDFDDLDRWLTNGGFLPAAWRTRA